MDIEFGVNEVACATSVVLAAGTIGTGLAAAAAAGTAAKVALTAAAIGLSGVGAGSITAWLDTSSDTTRHYFANVRKHSMVLIAGLSQFAAQTIVQGIVHGIAEGISDLFREKIAGPRTIRVLS